MKSQQKTVFIIFNGFGLGGVQRKIVDLVNIVGDLKKYRDVQLHLVFFNRIEEEFPFSKLIQNRKVIIHNGLPNGTRARRFFFVLNLALLIHRYSPQTIFLFLHFFAPHVLLTKLMFWSKKIKYIISQDNILSLENRQPYVDHVKAWWQLRLAYRFADVVITQTQFAKNDLVKTLHVQPEKIHVIPNWSLEHTPRKTGDRPVDILYCGRFASQKRIDRVISCVEKVVRRLPDTTIQLIGAGTTSDTQQLISDIFQKNLGRCVQILYPKLDVQYDLAKAKVLILASDFEGMPLVVLEAMSLGVVPVVLRYPGVEEYIDHQKSGFVVDTEVELVDHIVFLLTHTAARRKIATQAKAIAAKTFGLKNALATLDLTLAEK